MKNTSNFSKAAFATLAAASLALLPSCKVDKTEEGSLPEVEVKGGNLPEYDVKGPDVAVGTKTKTIEVEVPAVDVDIPTDANPNPKAKVGTE